MSVSCTRTVICRQNRGQAEIWPEHPKPSMLFYAKKSIFLSRDCHSKIKHCPKVTAVGIPIRRFSYLPSDVSCEYMSQRNKKITFHQKGRRAIFYRRVSTWHFLKAVVWRDQSHLKRGNCCLNSKIPAVVLVMHML